ncbi:hypothetical protein C4F40_15195 [Sphingobacterium sp. Ka21]|uniref:Uncharacterized protein n=2 Tax=Sphingobacterium pedocola TaxID=2082722 RepID=A0ABR9T9Q1_9SPHI|nr:hypothetical protein [Sphingobacterium pedocola]
MGVLLVALMGAVRAQNATLQINEAALRAGQVSFNASGFQYNSVVSLLPGLQARTAGTNFSSTNSTAVVPVNRVSLTLNRTGVDYTTVMLSATEQNLFSTIIGLFSTGAFSLRYAINNLNNYAWVLGDYQTILHLRITGINLGVSVNPTSALLNLAVPAILTPNTTPSDILLHVNSFDHFRNGYTSSALGQISMLHTVPMQFSLATASTKFTFSNGATGVSDPNGLTSALQYMVTAPQGGTTISLGTTKQKFYSVATVPVGNKTSLTPQIKIGAAALKQHFINKGVYSTTFDLQVQDKDTTPSVSKTTTNNLTVQVADMGELKLSNAAVDLAFTSADHYRNGVSSTLAEHITVSKTTPYQVSVRANSANFTFGPNVIPVSSLQIGPATGETGVNTIAELSTQSQVLISSNVPQVDKKYGIRYAIPSIKTAALINKAKGKYTAVITYTLTAL